MKHLLSIALTVHLVFSGGLTTYGNDSTEFRTTHTTSWKDVNESTRESAEDLNAHLYYDVLENAINKKEPFADFVNRIREEQRQKEIKETLLRQEEEAKQEAQRLLDLEHSKQQNNAQHQSAKNGTNVTAQPTSVTSNSNGTKPNPVPKYTQYVSLGNSSYPFKILAHNTSVAQSFIDSNPGSYGMWKNVTYATSFDILFAHYYAAGKLVYDSNVGDVITLHYADGSTKSYRVQSKVVVSVRDYYSSNTPLWNKVGLDFDLMIKTCYKVGATDLVITLTEI